MFATNAKRGIAGKRSFPHPANLRQRLDGAATGFEPAIARRHGSGLADDELLGLIDPREHCRLESIGNEEMNEDRASSVLGGI